MHDAGPLTTNPAAMAGRFAGGLATRGNEDVKPRVDWRYVARPTAQMFRVIGEFFVGAWILVIVLYISQRYPLIAHRLISVFVVLVVINYCVFRVKYELLRRRFVKIAKLEKKRKELLTPPEN